MIGPRSYFSSTCSCWFYCDTPLLTALLFVTNESVVQMLKVSECCFLGIEHSKYIYMYIYVYTEILVLSNFYFTES